MILEATDRTPAALDAWQRVRPLCQQLGDTKGLLEALEGTARTTPAGRAVTRRQHPGVRGGTGAGATLGDEGRALALRNTLGILEWSAGRYASALTHYEAALLLVRADGDPAQEASDPQQPRGDADGAPEARRSADGPRGEHRRQPPRAVIGCSSPTRSPPWASCAIGEQPNGPRATSSSRAISGTRSDDRPGEGWMLLRLAETHAALGDTGADGRRTWTPSGSPRKPGTRRWRSPAAP